MKLHLPRSLRAAIVACLSLAAPLSQTVATGALVVGAISYSISSQAQAEILENGTASDWHGDANSLILSEENGEEPRYFLIGEDSIQNLTIGTGTSECFGGIGEQGTFTTATNIRLLNSTSLESRHGGAFNMYGATLSIGEQGDNTASAGLVFNNEIQYHFEELNGGGTFHIHNNYSETCFASFELINNFDGTITTNSSLFGWSPSQTGMLKIAAVNVDASLANGTTIDGNIHSTGLTFTGTGTLSITGSLTYTGTTLSMENDGSLTIAALNNTSDLSLVYDADGTTALIDSIIGTGSISLDLSAYASWDGSSDIKLGILATGWAVTDEQILSFITGINSEIDFELKEVDGYWTITAVSYSGVSDQSPAITGGHQVTLNSDLGASDTSYLTFDGTMYKEVVIESMWVRLDVNGDIASDVLINGKYVIQNAPGAANNASLGTLTLQSWRDMGSGLDGSTQEYNAILCENNDAPELDSAYQFDKLTTNLSAEGAIDSFELLINANAGGESVFKVTFDTIENFNGSIYTYGEGDFANNATGGHLWVSNIIVGEGYSTVLVGEKIHSDGLNYSGSGSLNIKGVLNYGGSSLSMMNQGQLEIVQLNGNGALTLGYGDGSGLIANIGFGEGITSLELDLSGLTDAGLLEYSLSGEDIDLGVSAFTGDITFIDFGSLSEWQLDTENWTLVFTGDSPDVAPSVITWGSSDSTLGGDVIPGADTLVLFTEEGQPNVSVSGSVEAATLQISSGDYSFNAADDAASITTGELKLTGGSLSTSVDITADKVNVAAGSSLTISAKSMSATSFTLEGSLINNASLSAGKLVMGEAASLENNGTLTLGHGSTLTSITGTGTLALSDNAKVSALSIQGSVQLGSGSSLSLTGESTLSAITGKGSIDASNTILNLAAGINSSTSIKAGTLVSAAGASSLGNITANIIELGSLGELTVGSLDAIGDTLTLDVSNALDVNADGFGESELTILKGSSDSLLAEGMLSTDIVFDNATQDAILEFSRNEGSIVSTVIDGSELVLQFEKMVEDTYYAGLDFYMDAEGNAQDIFQEGSKSNLASYDAFDSVTSIDMSKGNSTLDLTGAQNDSAKDSFELNNLTGSGTLTLAGAGASQDRFDILNSNGETTNVAGGLVVDNVSVGLTEGTSFSKVVLNENGLLDGTLNLADKGSAELNGDASGLFVSAGEATSISLKGNTIGGLDINKGKLSLGAISSTVSAVSTNGSPSYDSYYTKVTESSSIEGSDISLSINSDDLTNNSSILIFSGADVTISSTTITITDTSEDDSRVLGDILGMTITISDDQASSFVGGELVFEDGLLGDSSLSWEVSQDGLSYTATFDDNQFATIAKTANGRAGMQMVTDVVLSSPDGDIKKVIDSINIYRATGNLAAADSLAAAMAGASTTSLGSAAVSDISRQLSSIRNRTRSMGVNPNVVHEDMPYFNGWMAAEGNSSTLDQDGTAAGHSLSSVGGSIGAEVDLSEKLSLGLAYSYLLGDLSTDGPDRASGTLDSMYGTLYARINNKRWNHSLVLSFGGVDAELDRTINTSTSQYKTSGSTSGSSFGLMYEVGYTYALNEDTSTCLQPVVNLSYVNSSISGYTEQGGNGRLTVGDQKNNYFTISAGAVLETLFGEDIYNRSSVFNARLMLKVDAGDQYAEADVKLTDFASASQTVKGAERGAVGLELGAGITVPVTDSTGAIFVDASCDLRSGMSSVNGTIGYRFSF